MGAKLWESKEGGSKLTLRQAFTVNNFFYEQEPRVGVPGLLEYRVSRTLLDDLSLMQHQDFVGKVGNDRKIMAYQEQGAAACLDLAQHAQDLSLNGDIEGCRRLIGDQDTRVQGQGARDQRSLAQPSG